MRPRKLLTLFSLFIAILLGGCKKDTFQEVVGTCPEVLSTIPARDAVGVPLDQVIRATFKSKMDPATITGDVFTLTASPALPGTLTYDDATSTLSFVPDSLLNVNTTYRATIKRSAKDRMGNALQEDYVWTFATGAILSPMVVCSDPAIDAVNVIVNKVVKACFNMPMDPVTLNNGTFVLYQNGNIIPGAVTYANAVAYFTPNDQLLNNTLYTAVVTRGAQSSTGVPLQFDFAWSFTTSNIAAPVVVSTTPTPNETGVALNVPVTATFSVPMDPLTILPTSFLLMQGVNVVNGIVSYAGNTATFTPDVPLLSGLSYTATITTAALDLSGTPMDNDYNWTFSTVTPLGPAVVNLNTVARFGIMAGVGVRNNAGFSVINDLDVGIYPGFRVSVVGFPPAVVVNGAIYAADDLIPAGTAAMLQQAQLDLVAAYDFAAAATTPAPQTVSGDLGGTTLAPGIYKSTSSMLIQSGNLTLDAQGDANAVWIFQIASAFTTVGGAGGSVILSGGAQAKNVFWQTGSSATIGDFTVFKGNILALQSITMNSGAVAEGRMLARNGSVVMTSGNTINRP